MLAEGGEAAAGRADQRRKAAADVDMDAHRRLGDGFNSHRRPVAAEQAKDGDGAGDGGDGADPGARWRDFHGCIYTTTKPIVQPERLAHSAAMTRLTEYTSYADAQAHFSAA